VVCTPAHTHIDIALAAIRSGSGLLIEKPLSIGLEQVNEFQREMASAGKFVGIAYVNHFVPAVRNVRDFLRQAILGKPFQVSVVAGQHFPTFRPAYRDIYYTRHETGGGAIQDALTHLVNAVEWLIGPTSRVFCEAAHQVLEGVTVEDTVSVTARNNDALVSYSLNQFQAPNEIVIQIHCERGSLKIELHEQRWAVFRAGDSAWDYRSAPINHRDDLFIAQAHAFLDGLEGKSNALCTCDEAIQSLKVNLAALESARTGQTVTIA
jgi:predicted dehydrogenase